VFYTHLWVEKVLKAMVAEQLGNESVRHIHSLSTLFHMTDTDAPTDGFRAFLVRLTPHSVGARYLPQLCRIRQSNTHQPCTTS
jgi:HEPN domain-containing protein